MKIRKKIAVKILAIWLVGFAGSICEGVAQPVEITRVGQWSSQGLGNVFGIAISGNYAYLANALQVIDISNPTNPVRVGGTNMSGSANAVAVSGNYAYVAANDYGLQVINISDPANPLSVGTIYLTNSARSVALAGNHAYVAALPYGLQVIDISNPANPVNLGVVSRNAYSVAVSGNYAYVGSYSGMRVIDISNPGNPVQVGGFGTGGSTVSAALSGNYAYLANGRAGLEVIDINNAAAPVRVGGYYSSGNAQDVAVSGNYAYVADYYEGLQVISISNPAAPVRVGGYVTSSPARKISVSGNHAYVVHSRLEILDITIPTNPVSRSTYSIATNYYPYGATYSLVGRIAVSGSYAYLPYGGLYQTMECGDYLATVSFGGIEVVDVSNPANPVRKAVYNPRRQYLGVTLSGSYLYAAYGYSFSCPPWAGNYSYTEGGLDVFSVSNPTNLVYLSGYSTNVYPSDVAVSSNYVYLAGSAPRFQVIDVSNPTNVTLVAGYNTGGAAFGVAASGNYAYVADGAQGLQILRVGPPEVFLTAERDGNELRLKWPASATNFILQSTATLSPPQWEPAGGTPQIQDGFYRVSVSVTNASAFYRLRRP